MFLILTAASLLAVGCRGVDQIDRKPIEVLYAEAMLAAETREQSMNPLLNSPNCGGACPQEMPLSLASPESSQGTGHPVEPATELLAPSPIRVSNGWQRSYTASTDLPDAGLVTPRGIDKPVSEAFEETDVVEAIRILASLAEVSVIIDDSIGGVTSATIDNATFEQALDKILMPLGLMYAYRNDTYIILPPDPNSPLFERVSERLYYTPLHNTSEQLVSLLPLRYKPFLQSHEDRNLVIIDAPAVIGREITSRLQDLDQPVPQVELEAIVCVVAPDSGFRFGLDWGHVVGINGVQTMKAGLTGLTFTGSASRQGLSDTFSDFAVTSAFVRLLSQEGYITIRAAPRVTTKDGEKAEISINRETFFSLQPTDSNVFFRQDVQKVQAGISLEITPRVHGDVVSVNIGKAEVSEDIRSSEARAELTSNPYPIINRRVVSTNVDVQDGHTIVIGGLVQRQTVDRINRIPGLSKIPVAGKFFQTVEKQEQDAEVAIFITPRIVSRKPECPIQGAP